MTSAMGTEGIITIQQSSDMHAQMRRSSVLPQDFPSASLHTQRMAHPGSWSTGTYDFILLRFQKMDSLRNSHKITAYF